MSSFSQLTKVSELAKQGFKQCAAQPGEEIASGAVVRMEDTEGHVVVVSSDGSVKPETPGPA